MRILMIEDLPVVARSTKEALTTLDHSISVDIAGNLATAVKYVENGNQYDVALVDLSLPDASGSDAPVQIRHLCPRTVIVVVTGNESTELALDLMRMGIQDYIPKSEATPLRVLRTIRLARERHEREMLLQKTAYLDQLTGALNRRGLVAELRNALASAKRLRLAAALCTLDLDRFKQINDRYGHPAGDAVLKECCGRLKDNTRENDHVGRAGGDEFWIILNGISPDTGVRAAAEKMLACFDRPVEAEGRRIRVGASIGVAVAPVHARTIDDWIRKSDEALYDAKNGGRSRWSLYDTPVVAAAVAAPQH